MKKQNDKVLTEKVFIDTIRELRETFASKKDLEALATKDDLKNLVTKEDLKQEFKNFAETELNSVSEQIMNAIEATDKEVKNHERRISALEHAKN